MQLVDIARELNVTQPTITYHLNKWRNKPENFKLLYNQFVKDISKSLMEKTLAISESIEPGKIPHGQRMMNTAIGIDKLRLIHGQSTENVDARVLQERIDTTNIQLEGLAKKAGCTVEELRSMVKKPQTHITKEEYDPQSTST